MERMRFTCSDKIEMSNVATWIVLANCRLDLQTKSTQVHSTGLPLASLSPRGRDGRVGASEGKGVGLGEGRGRDLL